MSRERQHVTWTDVGRMVRTLLVQLPRDYDNIMVITRGGMVPACLISERTNIRNILCAAVVFYEGSQQKYEEPMFVQFPPDDHVKGRRVLVIDDVWDTGSTIVAVRDRLRAAGATAEVCVLHYKPARSRFPGDKPDYYAEETDGWIVYPWDPDLPLP
ncbi:MAG: phosphoribosyltransferase [Candidatus Rokubacteria bacterium]|nr:phosphoribosyltransferase [Candidatus Rokubacteria bacterium]